MTIRIKILQKIIHPNPMSILVLFALVVQLYIRHVKSR